MTLPFQGRLVPAGRLAREFDTLFNGWNTYPWAETASGRPAGVFPALNAWADDDNLYVEGEIPGLGMDDIQITVLGDELTLSGDRQDVLDENTSHHRRERGVGPFTRTLQLPWAVDSDKVEARLHDGVLTITLPKTEALRPRRIEVKAS